MTRRELAAMACKIMALYVALSALTWIVQFAISAIPAIWEMIVLGFTYSRASPVITMSAYLVSAVVGAAVLWCGSDYFARRMANDDHTPVTSEAWDPETCLSIAMAAIGLSVAIDSLNRLVYFMPEINRIAALSGDLNADPRWWIEIFATVMTLSIGVWLMFGSRGLARFVRWARSARPGEPRLEREDVPTGE